jgi:signal transduction histidine kinase
MAMNLKTKIWLTIAAIVLMFSFFTLYYFPNQQAKLLLKNYNNEVQNLANTVALGVKIAITEQNFEGVQTAMEFVKDDPRLEFVSMLQTDTVWNNEHTNYKVNEQLFKTYPEKAIVPVSVSSDSVIVKRSPFVTSVMSGAILIGFSTRAIDAGKQQIEITSLVVSGVVFIIGIILGFWLSKTISAPVSALRNAAIRVGEGDFTQRVESESNNEIGQLGKSFNKMVEDLLKTTTKLSEANGSLVQTNTALNNTLLELKSAQAQLIQSEKMASLGELTAGVAHEIQNPLNFVNNFSDINQELLDELKNHLLTDDKQEALSLADDIKENERKINEHGKRADSIVKGMLQHARASTNTKEPTNINQLADEYLRLSYQGMRARDKSFNAAIETNFDENIEQVSVVPQDIGRVLLNLFNNAFYAVQEKKAKFNGIYEPVVSVSTKTEGVNVLITVKDNGEGMPQKVKDKVFQPFFTTKPTGEGTGLGLYLSYDIITKGHGGEIKVESIEGEGASFIIHLPLQS